MSKAKIGIIGGNEDIPELIPTVTIPFYTKRDILGEMDVVIFTGGSDVSPAVYAENNRHSSCNPERDLLELSVLTSLFRINTIKASNGKPQVKIFGFCRGHQLINAALGGTLIQDIQTELGSVHSTDDHIIMPGMWQNSSMETLFPTINSYHHQAVATPGIGLDVILRSRDGVIESTSSLDGNIVTVQFHPEWGGIGVDYFRRVYETSKLIWEA